MTLHFAAGAAFDSSGKLVAGADGFNLVDLQTVDQVNALPAGDKALIWLNEGSGVTQSFIDKVTPLLNNSKVFGFYLFDEPDPTGQWNTQVKASDLMAESDWIHSHFAGAKTFITMMNMGDTSHPIYANTYNYANTHIDLFGISAYPVWSDTKQSPDYAMIDRNYDAAVASGISSNEIVPIYQTFGGGAWVTNDGSSYAMPTAAQEQTMLDRWAKLDPNPAFDYAYAWASQNGDTGLSQSTELQQVFAQHNAAGQTVLSGPAPGGVLDLAATPYSAGDETVLTVTATGGMLKIVDTRHGNAVIGAFTLTGQFTDGVFTLASDGASGTDLTLTRTVPLKVAAGDVVTANLPSGAGLAIVDRYNADGSLFREGNVIVGSNGSFVFHYSGGSYFAGRSFASYDNVCSRSGTLLRQTLYNSDGSVLIGLTVTPLSSGGVDNHYAGGSYFTAKPFASYDNVLSAAHVLQSQTLYNPDGSTYRTDTVTKLGNSQSLHHLAGGSFFDSAGYNAWDRLVDASNKLLEQELYNKDGSHTFSVIGDGLTVTANHNDVVSLIGKQETLRVAGSGFGHDVVSGLGIGDKISFAKSLLSGYQDMLSHATGSISTTIADTHGDTLTLDGVARSTLSASLFSFV